MVKSARDSYNNAFSEEKYREFLAAIEKHFPGSLDFKIAETPVFVGKEMGQQMIETCEYIIDRVMAPDFMQLTDRAIPPGKGLDKKKPIASLSLLISAFVKMSQANCSQH